MTDDMENTSNENTQGWLASRAGIGLVISMAVVGVASLASISYYIADYVGARHELSVAHRQCAEAAKELEYSKD